MCKSLLGETDEVAQQAIKEFSSYLDVASKPDALEAYKSRIVTDEPVLKFYGANKEFIDYEGFEAMLSGPAETGKTYAALYKLHCLALRYPRMQGVIVRKIRDTLKTTVLQTWTRIIEGSGVRTFGGESPVFYAYPNGSKIWVAGMDKPGKVLSSERDVIYVNQAEELSLEDWETLTSRATGRGSRMPFTQVIGDCNPGSESHWILARANEGHLKMFYSKHIYNPTLYDQVTGVLTQQGIKSIGVLSRMTGTRRARYFEGRWVSQEGVVYEFDASVHVKPSDFKIGDDWPILLSIDFGYVNPFVCQWWALDGDNRMYCYRYIYQTGKTVGQMADEIKRLMAGVGEAEWASMGDSDEGRKKREQMWLESSEWKRCIGVVSDHDAEDRATLNHAGIKTIAARKAIKDGIEKVQDRLAIQGDGRARLFLIQGALVKADETLMAEAKVYTAQMEFGAYVWPVSDGGKSVKEEPVKANDHFMDAMRYAVMQADRKRVKYGM